MWFVFLLRKRLCSNSTLGKKIVLFLLQRSAIGKRIHVEVLPPPQSLIRPWLLCRISWVPVLLTTSGFEFKQDIDPVAVCACLTVSFRYLSENIAISYANVILAHRDAELSGSSLPTEVKARLRSAFFTPDSLFGSALEAAIKKQADAQRYTALAFLPTMFTQRDVS